VPETALQPADTPDFEAASSRINRNMKSIVLILAFGCALSAVHARKVPQQTVYSSVAAALSENKKLSTLFEAFKVN